ncbi:prepilin peptidase [Halocynthiibacter sp. C4]|uniref:prepilin peptidase n=1 Tax=Halocynthiibacter sp. C4 TaxID=2992758 RepID=UPI00237BC481|nr:prepilin peptidase [Halocynthiibacter sp. C4]MDE0589530.1 prepilin peptidase [Halocynthiibacter sp. C4]
MLTQLIPLMLLSPILVAIAVCDMRQLRIPNMLCLIAVGLFVLTLPMLPLGEAALRAGVAGLVFVIGFVLFAFRIIGGGDVKAMSALLLFIPTTTLSLFSLVFSFSLIIGVTFIVTLRSVPRMQRTGLASMQAVGRFPMGV